MTPIELYPDFPTVRCTRCATVYELVSDTAPGLHLIVGDCPNCGCETFHTSMPCDGDTAVGSAA